MKRRGFNQDSVLVLLLLFLTFALLLVALGCNVRTQAASNPVMTPGSQQLPFAEGKVVTIPANTFIYIRLQKTISSAKARAGQDFAAVLDEPLRVDGQTAIPQGTALAGKIVAASEPKHRQSANYLRITLSSLTLNGKPVPLQTNSVFVGDGGYKNHSLAFTGGEGRAFLGTVGRSSAAYTAEKEVGLAADRRIGFRLTQPINVP